MEEDRSRFGILVGKVCLVLVGVIIAGFLIRFWGIGLLVLLAGVLVFLIRHWGKIPDPEPSFEEIMGTLRAEKRARREREMREFDSEYLMIQIMAERNPPLARGRRFPEAHWAGCPSACSILKTRREGV